MSLANVVQTVPLDSITVIHHPDHLIRLLQTDPTFYPGCTGVQRILDQLGQYLREGRYGDRRP